MEDLTMSNDNSYASKTDASDPNAPKRKRNRHKNKKDKQAQEETKDAKMTDTQPKYQ